MARQVLENGVVLPAEYSDDWYDDMTSNLTKLDDVIGSDSEKLSSADVGAAALSNNYNDLDNLPTIPTVNDATLTIQKNGVDVQTFTANASSNVTANIIVPTKTSDLTNDSNFVDTSNPAVSSGITSAKVTSYDSHIADTDIHVTTADKAKWNNGVLQAYVFRYSSTALVASSTNSNTLLDNTDNLKVGDKVIDSDGVLFSITAIDTVNSTFTVGSALIDLALDANVMHTSGNETVGGVKTFTDSIQLKSNTAECGVTSGNIQFYLMDKNNVGLSKINQGVYSSGVSYITLQLYSRDSNNQTITNTITYQYSDNSNKTYLLPTDTKVDLGSTGNRWGKIYGTEYYYGNNNVEFSTKFVTSDTAQTISGGKTFSVTPYIYNSDVNGSSPNLYLRNQLSEKGNTANPNSQQIVFVDKNAKRLSQIQVNKGVSGETSLSFRIESIDNADNDINSQINYYITKSGGKNFTANANNEVNLGISGNKWKDVNTYLINGLTPSSLSLPTDNIANIIDISGYLTVLDGSQANTYQAPDNGYIGITMSNCTGIQAYITGFWGNQIVRPTAGAIRFFMPICKNMTANILVFGGTVDNARFFPCQGNV